MKSAHGKPQLFIILKLLCGLLQAVGYHTGILFSLNYACCYYSKLLRIYHILQFLHQVLRYSFIATTDEYKQIIHGMKTYKHFMDLRLFEKKSTKNTFSTISMLNKAIKWERKH